VSRRKHFSLLVVRGDGAHVVRVSRRVATAALVSLVLASAALGALTSEWLPLPGVMRAPRPYAEQISTQRAALDLVRGRIAEMRREVAAWREIHARLLDAFGPDGKPGGRDTGIGGPATPIERAPATSSPGDELNRLAASIAEESLNLMALEKLMARAGKMLAALPSRWPVRGPVNSEFGRRLSPWSRTPEFHAGIDIRAERGTPIQAPAAGTVEFAGPHAEYGLAVILDHGNDIRSIYGHLSRIAVQVGKRVDRGTDLGLTGNTGRSSGPHLHYEILVKGHAVNPRAYLWD
jgi:murein DD-endopeptidase MepM/ murein hydrolase activator NlpD